MTPRAFAAEDICRILKAAKSSNLKDLEYDGLKISFHASSQETVEVGKESLPGQVKQTQKDDRPGDLILDEETKEILDEIEAENAMIQDPAEYERRLLDERVFSGDEDQGDTIGRGSASER